MSGMSPRNSPTLETHEVNIYGKSFGETSGVHAAFIDPTECSTAQHVSDSSVKKPVVRVFTLTDTFDKQILCKVPVGIGIAKTVRVTSDGQFSILASQFSYDGKRTMDTQCKKLTTLIGRS